MTRWFQFVLPIGLPQARVRRGAFRLPTVADELSAAAEPEVVAEPRSFQLHLLARLVGRLGDFEYPGAGVLRHLFSADFRYLVARVAAAERQATREAGGSGAHRMPPELCFRMDRVAPLESVESLAQRSPVRPRLQPETASVQTIGRPPDDPQPVRIDSTRKNPAASPVEPAPAPSAPRAATPTPSTPPSVPRSDQAAEPPAPSAPAAFAAQTTSPLVGLTVSTPAPVGPAEVPISAPRRVRVTSSADAPPVRLPARSEPPVALRAPPAVPLLATASAPSQPRYRAPEPASPPPSPDTSAKRRSLRTAPPGPAMEPPERSPHMSESASVVSHGAAPPDRWPPLPAEVGDELVGDPAGEPTWASLDDNPVQPDSTESAWRWLRRRTR